ncbi:hypothetical protein DBR06_SOUSAS510352, partial [Sousa chinensis]
QGPLPPNAPVKPTSRRASGRPLRPVAPALQEVHRGHHLLAASDGELPASHAVVTELRGQELGAGLLWEEALPGHLVPEAVDHVPLVQQQEGHDSRDLPQRVLADQERPQAGAQLLLSLCRHRRGPGPVGAVCAQGQRAGRVLQHEARDLRAAIAAEEHVDGIVEVVRALRLQEAVQLVQQRRRQELHVVQKQERGLLLRLGPRHDVGHAPRQLLATVLRGARLGAVVPRVVLQHERAVLEHRAEVARQQAAHMALAHAAGPVQRQEQRAAVHVRGQVVPQQRHDALHGRRLAEHGTLQRLLQPVKVIALRVIVQVLDGVEHLEAHDGHEQQQATLRAAPALHARPVLARRLGVEHQAAAPALLSRRPRGQLRRAVEGEELRLVRVRARRPGLGVRPHGRRREAPLAQEAHATAQADHGAHGRDHARAGGDVVRCRGLRTGLAAVHGAGAALGMQVTLPATGRRRGSPDFRPADWD